MIKWKRVMRIARKIAGVPVCFHLSTSLPIRANVQGTKENGFDVILGAVKNKSDADIVDSIAHEMAHICTMSEKHDAMFVETLDEMREEFSECV